MIFERRSAGLEKRAWLGVQFFRQNATRPDSLLGREFDERRGFSGGIQRPARRHAVEMRSNPKWVAMRAGVIVTLLVRQENHDIGVTGQGV